MKKIYLAILSLLLFATIGYSQNITMSSTAQNGVCAGTYLDPGGTGNYSNNQNFTQTFTPSAGARMQFVFSSFNTEATFDFLYIYDGNSTAATLIGKYSGTQIAAGQTFTSTAPDGSLTFKFTSDPGTVKAGWAATISCVAVPYRAQLSALNTGTPAAWCAGETRNVNITVKNNGSVTWTSGGSGVNFSYWWSNQSGHDANPRILPFAGLTPGASQILTIPITAPVTGSPLTLNFDLVKEGACWFSDNVTGCSGPGNSVFVSPSITINALPAAPTGTSPEVFCTITTPAPTVANLVAAGTTIKWYAAASGGTALATTTALVNGTTYYASQTNASGCESATRLAIVATISDPSPPTGTATQSFCTINNPTVASLAATGTTIKWYAAATGGTVLAPATVLVNGTHYYASQTVGSCESDTRLDVTAVVTNTPAPTGTATQSFCTIDNPTVANLVATGTAIQWYAAATGGTALPSTTVLVNGTHYYASQTLTSCESAIRLNVTATIGNPVAPTGAASQLFCADANPTVASLTATGTGILWYTAATGGTALSTATALVNGTHYFASQTLSGCESSLRLDVTATIYQPVVITTNPGPATQTVCATNPVTYSVTANGSGLTYQWLKNGSPISNSANVTGATTATLNIIQAQVADNGNYSVTVTGTAPCTPVTSTIATLTVDQKITISSQPAAASTICQGQPYTISATAAGTVATYVWKKGGIFYANAVYDGVNSYSLTIPAVVPGDAGSYQLTLDDGTGVGCTSTISNVAALTVNVTSVGGTVSGSTSVCSGTNSGSVTLSGQTGNVIRWESSPDGTVWTGLPANTTTTQAYSNLTQTTLYRAVVQSGICPSDNAAAATITVNPIPNAIATPSSQTICSGGTITSIALSSIVSGTTYTWTRNNPAVTGIANSGSGNISGTLTNTTAAPITVTFTITPTASTCVGAAITATVLVNPTPNAVATPASQTKCSGVAITAIALTSTTTGTTFDWVRDNPGVTGIANSGSGNITGTLINTTAAPITVTFTITPTANGCPGAPITATVLVNPTPIVVATPASQTICSGSTITAIALTSTTAGTTYSWTRDNTAGVTGIAATGSGNISGTLTNTTAAPITVTFTITPIASTCGGAPITATVLVNPSPATTRTPATQIICSGGAIATIALSSTTTGATFAWTRDNNAGVTGIAASGSGNISGNLTNTTAAPITVTFTITASANSCPGASVTATVLVNPTPNVTATPASQTKCSGTAITTIALTSTTTGTAYGWTRDNTVGVTGIAASGSGNISGTLTNTTTAPITVTFTITPTYSTCPGTPITATVLVNPTANTIPAPASQTICSASTITTIALTSTTSGTTFTWSRNNTGTTTGIPANGSGDISGALTNTTANPVTTTFTIVPTANGCAGSNSTATVLVNPTPNVTATPASQTKCSGSAITTIALSSSTSGTTYAWTRDNTATVTGIAASGTGNITGTLTNPSAAPITVTFTITPTANGCPGTPITATVLVNPIPNVTAATTSQTSCSGSAITPIILSSTTTSTTYTWTRNNTASVTGMAASGSGNISGTLVNATTAPITVTFTITPTYSSCSGSSTTSTVTVNPLATATISGTATVCQNDPAAIITFTNPEALSETVTYNINGGAATTINVPANGTATVTAPTTAFGTFAYNLVSAVYQTVPACSNPVSGSATITVKTAPTGSLTATETSGTPNDNKICTGSPVTFTATASYGSYIFKVNGTTVQSGTSNIWSSSTLANGASITVDVANSVNCGVTFGPVVITVNPLPAPTLISDKASICSGDNVTFTGTAGFANYNFKVNGSAVQSGTSNTYTDNGFNNGDAVTVDVTNANGCIGTSNSITLAVRPLPTGSLTPAVAEICSGDPVTLTATAGFTTYEFFVNGVSVQNSATRTYVANYSAPAVVTVTATNSFNCSAILDTSVINVNPLPTGTLTATEASGTANDNSICAGTTVSFTATVGYANYNFKVNGVSKQNGASNTYSNSTFANGDVVTVTVSTGSTCSADFNPITITVVASPTGTLTVSPSNKICVGDNATFTATGGFANYTFKVNGNTEQNGSSNIYNTTALANSDVVSVEVTNANSCVTIFNTITMTVNALPTGTLVPVETSGLTPNDGIICAGATITFTAPAGFTNYNFLLNGASVQNGASGTYLNSTLANNDSVQVVISNTNGCIALLNTIKVTVNAVPVVSATTGSLDVCVSSTTTLSNTTPGGVWSSLNPGIATVDAGGVVTGVAAGSATISYTVTNANGCTTVVNSVVSVHALPVVAAIGGTLNVCIGLTTQLTDATSGGTWNSSDNSIATVSATGLVTGIAAGPVSITYSVTNGFSCTTVATATVTVNALPVVAPITFTAPATSFDVCVGNNITLADATTGGAWSSGNTGVATITSAGVVKGIADGTATISYKVTNGSGCITIVTQDVNVHALPVVTLDGPNPICPNSTETYTTQAGESNYVWTFTGGTLVSGGTSTDNTITITWDKPGARTIFVNYTNSFGCSGATSATLTTSTGTVPTLTGPNAVCLNDNGSYATQGSQTDYTWIANGGTITSGGTGTDNTVVINWDVAGAGSVSINFTDVNGCTGAVPTVLPVTVRPLPTVVTHDQSTCSPGTVNLTSAAVTAGSTSGLTYTYFTDAAATTAYATPTTAGAGTYYIKGSTAQGCFTIQPVTVTVNPTPAVTVTNPGAVCSPSTVDITLPTVTAGSDTGLTFTYYTNAAATTVYNTPTAATAGTYYIKGSTAAGCSAVQPVTVTVNPTPTVVTHNSTATCAPSAVDLTAPSITAGSTAGLTYTYYTDAAATNVYATPTAAGSGTYYIKGTTGAGCSDIKPVTITINPAPTVVITNPGAVCSPATVNITLPAVTAGSTAGLTYTYYTDAAGTNVYSTPTAATNGTYYIKGSTGPGCSDIKPVIVTVNPTPTVVITNPATVCAPSTVNLTLGSVTTGSTAGLTYTYFTNAAGTTVYSTPTAATAGTYYIKGTTGAGCSDIKPVTVTVNPAPTAAISGTANVCQNAPAPNVTFTGANGTAPYTFTYKINAGGNLTVVSSGNVATVSAPTATVGTFTYSLVSVKDASSTTCTATATGNAVITVNAPPVAFLLTPSPTASICQDDVLPLSATGSTPTTGSVTVSNGNINLAIPDATFFGLFPGTVTNNLSVTTVPTGAIINSINVTINVNHTFDGDLAFNIKAPNGGVLNLVDGRGGSGHNFVNTVISSASVNPISGSAPFTNTYAPDAHTNTGTPNPNTTAFSSLFSTPNGTWTFGAEDDGVGDVGSIVSWSITFNYTIPVSPLAVIWTPSTGLYTDAGAVTAYAGQALSTVYAKPAVGATTYTATASNGAGCTTTKTVAITVNAKPVVNISADYCIVPGRVRLTASSVPVATSYIWSTGAATQFIDVDIAGTYQVTAFGAGTCPGTASFTVATELVTNGDFEAGNVGFTTPVSGGNQYQFRADVGGNNELVPEGLYGVGPNPQTYHGSFWGKDHTTGTGNFMIVNGFPNGNPQPIVWQETVSVLPNTTYYFSAWAMSLNGTGPFASLQFNVNGAQVGSTANLTAGVNNNSNNGWVRFYGTWTSGSTVTNAVISITDQQGATGGNDFGLDDISFGTLSTFISLESDPGTDAQTVCKGTAITNITYNVGNGSTSGPTVTGLPAGVTSVFTGSVLTISGAPTVANGVYTYTITTTGTCNPLSVSGSITVQAPTIALSSGSISPTSCVGAPLSIGFTLGGTATGATVTGLPAGMTGTVSGTTYTISGTPTDPAGSYPYTITTTGTCTPQVTVSGTIKLQSQTVTLSSAPATSAQTVCINNPILTIRYAIGGTGTGATVTGLPPGVTGTYTSGFLNITGSPTSSAGSPYTYTVTTSGGSCAGATATGTITVTPAAAIALTSGSGTDGQTICSGVAITPVTYNITGATNATITSGTIPASFTGTFNAGVFTITGSSTVAGTYTYTITTTGGCASATASGTITVQAQTLALTAGTASPSVCINAPMTAISYTIGGTATGASVTGLPAGVTGTLTGNVFTISGTPTATAGGYTYTVTTTGSCTPVSVSGTITVQPAAVGGTITSASSFCSNASGTLTLTGQSGTVIRWEMSTDYGVTWSPIANTTISLTYSSIITGTWYRAVVGNGCGNVFSSVAKIDIHNLWTGNVSTDWNDAANWSDNLVPSTSCPIVTIPSSRPNQPILGSGTSTINNLDIKPGATVVITNATMQIAGTITNAGTFDVSNGTLELNGTSPQSIAGNMFAGNTLMNLTSSNSSGLNVSSVAGNTLNITGAIAFGNVNNANINTGNNIVLVSTATGTARVADITNNGLSSGNSFTGNVAVERYYPARRAWRLVTSPLSGAGTLFNTWQNNGVYTTGRGTYITGPGAAPATNGLDVSPQSNSSLKVGSNLTAVNNTFSTVLSNSTGNSDNKGFFLFVRGDRSASNFNIYFSNNTTLSSTGKLQTGGQHFDVTPTQDAFTLVGNPYASPIDFSKLGRTNIANRFYIWDPYLNTEQGGYIEFDDPLNTGVYTQSVASPGGQTKILQSSQAFFVQTATDGAASISFGETVKSTANNLGIFRPMNADQIATFRANLYLFNADTLVLADGNISQFDDRFNAGVDAQDALKFGNVYETLGILSGTSFLAADRRPSLVANDTIFLKFTKSRQRKYQFHFEPVALNPVLMPVLEDSYLKTRTPLSISNTSIVDFEVNADVASQSPTRFRIVFIAPLAYTSVKATQQKKDIATQWTVENEFSVKGYEVERSADSLNFTRVTSAATAAGTDGKATYNWLDPSAVTGNNYYRIKNLNQDGTIGYSKVVNVFIPKGAANISVYPNPAVNNVIGLELSYLPQGLYHVRLINQLGQVLLATDVAHPGGTALNTIIPNIKLLTGIYKLEVTKPDKTQTFINVMVR